MFSGNESEIFTVMLDKSTYFKKCNLIQFTDCLFHELGGDKLHRPPVVALNVQNAQLNLHFWTLC